MYYGACLCGNVKYQVNETFSEIECCHCLICRKAHASAFAMGVTVSRAGLNFISGEESLKKFESSPGKFRVFCNNCGSHLYAYRPLEPALIRLRPACLDIDLTAFSFKHIHCENKIITG